MRGHTSSIHQLARAVIDTPAVTTQEIQDDEGCWWALTIRPYCNFDHQIEGAVLTLANIDSLKRSLYWLSTT
jgi:two-component system, chemotaxis family, CheB/CheR fusion protein